MTSRLPWTLAVDPGLRHCGVALFEGTALYSAWLAKNSASKERGPEAWVSMGDKLLQSVIRRAPTRGHILHRLVVEVPQVYWNRNGGGRASDLIELAGVVGAVSQACPVLGRTHFLPRAWKGQVPKEIHNARTLARLSESEREAIDPSVPKSLRHNVVDAVGLGLFYLGRRTKVKKVT